MVELVAVRRPLLLASMLCLSGCFRYVPTSLEVTPPGEDVRLMVTRAGAFELGELTEVSTAVPVVRGALVRMEEREVLLLVPLENRRVGFHTEELGQTIRVPIGEILSVERREFDRTGTGLLAVGTAAVAAGVIFLIIESFGSSTRPGGPNPVESRIPIPLISVRIGS